MHGVTKIISTDDIMLISFSSVKPTFMAETLNKLADVGVVVDMISQTTPAGSDIQFSFTASYRYFDTAIKTIGGKSATPPMISGGYTKLYLFGEEMVESVGVAARALEALSKHEVEISMITTSDLDISILVRQEDADIAQKALEESYELI